MKLVKWLSWPPSLRWSLWWGWSAQPGLDFALNWSSPSGNVDGLINLEPVQDGRLSRIVQTKDEDPHLASSVDVPTEGKRCLWEVGRWLGKALFTRSSGALLFAFGACPIWHVSCGRLLVPEEGSENRWEQDAHGPRFGYAAVPCSWRCWFLDGLKGQSQKSKGQSTVLVMFGRTQDIQPSHFGATANFFVKNQLQEHEGWILSGSCWSLFHWPTRMTWPWPCSQECTVEPFAASVCYPTCLLELRTWCWNPSNFEGMFMYLLSMPKFDCREIWIEFCCLCLGKMLLFLVGRYLRCLASSPCVCNCRVLATPTCDSERKCFS